MAEQKPLFVDTDGVVKQFPASDTIPASNIPSGVGTSLGLVYAISSNQFKV